MHVLVSGSGGLVGSALVSTLLADGHQVTRLVRFPRQTGQPEVLWNPATGQLDLSSVHGLDGVVHLAGDSLAGGRWTAARKASIRSSRVDGTRLLSQALQRLAHPPQVLVSASAIGYYGDRGTDTLDEASAPGQGFLPDLCREWEAEAASAGAHGIRVVCLRFGVILSAAGGALTKMLPPFRLGLGGVLGNGQQYMSWVALDDVLGAIRTALGNASLQGPVNVTAPAAVTNRDFTNTLSRVLRRPAMLPVPASVLRLLLGELADAALLASARVTPAKLLAAGYAFRYPALEGALRHLLVA